MIEFFRNIWTWVQENQGNIITFITSSTFVSLVLTIVSLFKSKSSTDKNTLSINSIRETMNNVKSNYDDVNVIKETLLNSVQSVKDCLARLKDTENVVTNMENELNNKINAILEVQTIVYSTIKDESLRNAVNSILVTAKYEDSVSKAALEKEIVELKQKVSEQLTSVDDMVNETVDKVSTIVTGVPTENTENIENTRY